MNTSKNANILKFEHSVQWGKLIGFVLSYRFLLFSFVFVSTDQIISNVKWMVFCWSFRIITTFNNERVGLATDDINFRNQQTIDIPGNTPAHMTYKTNCSNSKLRIWQLRKQFITSELCRALHKNTQQYCHTNL